MSLSLSLSVCLSVSPSARSAFPHPQGSQGELTCSDPTSARSLQGPTHCPHGNQTDGRKHSSGSFQPCPASQDGPPEGFGCTGLLHKGHLGAAGSTSGPLPARRQGLRGRAVCGLWAGPASRALLTQHCRQVQAPAAPAALGSAGAPRLGCPFMACVGLPGPTTRRARLASVGAALPEADWPRPPASSADPGPWVLGMG